MYFSQKTVDSQIHISDAELDAADDYLQKKRTNAKSRLRGRFNGSRKKRHELVESKALNPEQVAGLEWEAWHQRALGKPVHRIAQAMNVSISQINIWLQDALAQVKAKTQGLIELDREIEVNRTETLLERYMPLGLPDNIIVARTCPT